MTQEAHQEIIRQSVSIDKVGRKATAKLPFVIDPVGKLTNNTRLATKRLESVCHKYATSEDVVQMINAAFEKLKDKGHIVYLDSLSEELQVKIKSAKCSYTVP